MRYIKHLKDSIGTGHSEVQIFLDFIETDKEYGTCSIENVIILQILP